MSSINLPRKKPGNKPVAPERGKSLKTDGRLSVSNKGVLNYSRKPHENEQASVVKELGNIVPGKFQRASNSIKGYWNTQFVTETRDKAFEEICEAVDKIAPEGTGFYRHHDEGWGFWKQPSSKS